MSTTLQIAEVARRSFHPGDVALLRGHRPADAPRSHRRGYRLYDETSLERLRFISAPSSSVAASTRSPTSHRLGRWPLCHGPGATADHRGGKGRRRPRADRSDDHPRRGAPARGSESLDRPGGRALRRVLRASPTIRHPPRPRRRYRSSPRPTRMTTTTRAPCPSRARSAPDRWRTGSTSGPPFWPTSESCSEASRPAAPSTTACASSSPEHRRHRDRPSRRGRAGVLPLLRLRPRDRRSRHRPRGPRPGRRATRPHRPLRRSGLTDMDTPSPKAGLGVLGAGAAACAACCAGPVLGSSPPPASPRCSAPWPSVSSDSWSSSLSPLLPGSADGAEPTPATPARDRCTSGRRSSRAGAR